ncbi:hypothetical protein DEU56DRAFT_755335 [Suillus clintonianus]|uniref:uncharacterized protein n=1 Tax=Suillus clintonianus TaxID=1904413 RepID=UPI001B864F09|nr:uncharacterized protein DEU56DRAFT_755335 [Suillus clintonianus]KAG2140103.1 hypothetical protein DEU56DRAFT_755335 [Suillus clintonianus]
MKRIYHCERLALARYCGRSECLWDCKLSNFSAESIFVLRSIAVWARKRWLVALQISSVIVRSIFQTTMSDSSSASNINTHTETSSKVYVIYGLLVVAELEILLMLLYRAVKGHGGWGNDNSLIRGLMLHNLLYCGCSFAFSLCLILTTIFLPVSGRCASRLGHANAQELLDIGPSVAQYLHGCFPHNVDDGSPR